MANALARAVIGSLTTNELLEQFEFTVKAFHYDPLCSMEPEFDLDDLREELLRRLEDQPK